MTCHAAVVHSPLYACDIGLHVFPVTKYARVREALAGAGDIHDSEVLEPPHLTRDDLLLVHTEEYLDDLDQLRWTPRTMWSELPLHADVVRAYKVAAGGTVFASREARKRGLGVHIGGGFHHAFSDRDGDPHSPWAFGNSPVALMRGFWHAHMGWIFERELTNQERFAPDLLADKDIVRVNKLFVWFTVATFVLPAVLGGLITWSWWGALTAFFWAGLVRVGFSHHVTWSTNSVCHMIGERPFKSRDKSANFWPLAILSMGEAWHNLHHADPTSARHGVRRGQIDISARLIWIFEKFGWVHDVRWPRPDRIAAKRAQSPGA